MLVVGVQYSDKGHIFLIYKNSFIHQKIQNGRYIHWHWKLRKNKGKSISIERMLNFTINKRTTNIKRA